MKKSTPAWAVIRNNTVNGMVEYPNCQLPIFPTKGTALKFVENNNYPDFRYDPVEWRPPDDVVKCTIVYEVPSKKRL